VLVVELVLRAALTGAGRVAALQHVEVLRMAGLRVGAGAVDQPVARGVVEEVFLGQVGEAGRGARRLGQVQLDDHRAEVRVDRHVPGTGAGLAAGRWGTDVLEVGVRRGRRARVRVGRPLAGRRRGGGGRAGRGRRGRRARSARLGLVAHGQRLDGDVLLRVATATVEAGEGVVRTRRGHLLHDVQTGGDLPEEGEVGG